MFFHKHHPDDFCRPPLLRTIMGRPPTTAHRYAPGAGSIGMQTFMPYTTLMVFNKHHPNELWRPSPLRTIMGRPLAIPYRYAPGGGSIGMQTFMPYTTLFSHLLWYFISTNSNDLCRPSPLRTIMGRPLAILHRYAPGAGSIGMQIFMPCTTLMVFHKHHPDDFFRPPPLRTIMGRPPTTAHR
jgi:hypothetical protein